jgi:flagellar assembly protein FliH
MALVRQATARDLTRDAIVLDLGDLRRQGEAYIAAAQEKAETILIEARAEREMMMIGADSTGFERGYQRGVIQGTQAGTVKGAQDAVAKQGEALAKLNSAWLEALGRFEAEREQMLAEAQRDVIKLACMLASRMTKRTIELDASVIVDQVAEVLGMVLQPTRLRLAVHPLDREIIEMAMPMLGERFASTRHMELVEDEGVPRGSCVARLVESGAEIDARLGVQLDRMVDALIPRPAGGG